MSRQSRWLGLTHTPNFRRLKFNLLTQSTENSPEIISDQKLAVMALHYGAELPNRQGALLR